MSEILEGSDAVRLKRTALLVQLPDVETMDAVSAINRFHANVRPTLIATATARRIVPPSPALWCC